MFTGGRRKVCEAQAVAAYVREQLFKVILETRPSIDSLTITSREVEDVYSDPSCVLRQDAPDNYCEVTILESLHSNRKRVSCVNTV